MWIAAWSGCNSSILGFSWNSNIASKHLKKTLFKVSRNVSLHTRDLKSTVRITKLIGKLPQQVADLAFLFPKTPFRWKGEEISWLNKSLDNKRVPIIVNLNSNRAANIFTSNPLEYWTFVLSNFLNETNEIDILFVPHDYRPGNDDTNFMRQVAENFDKSLWTRIHIATEKLDPQKIKMMCEKVDFIFTGRMHLGIAALGAGVPCVFVDYQGKVEGLLKLFKIPEMRLTKPFLEDPKSAAIFLMENFKNRKLTAKKIQQQLPHVLNLADKNFDDLYRLKGLF